MFHSDLIGCQVRLAPNSQVLVEGELFASVKFSDALWTLGSLSSLSCAFEYFFFFFSFSRASTHATALLLRTTEEGKIELQLPKGKKHEESDFKQINWFHLAT
jgi:hypothetical protein